jgi:GxxExxY protein
VLEYNQGNRGGLDEHWPQKRKRRGEMKSENNESHAPVEFLIYKNESYAIQGAVYTVYREMGSGFLEAVYQECMEKEMTSLNIPFRSKVELALTYKGEKLQQTFRPDFLCYEKIIVELKAVKEVTDEHRAQVFNYLKATGYRLGLLINFGHSPKATIQRVVL